MGRQQYCDMFHMFGSKGRRHDHGISIVKNDVEN